MSFCKNCGYKLNDEDLFCNNCGAKVEADDFNNDTSSKTSQIKPTATTGVPAQGVPQQNINKKKPGVLIAIVAVLAIIVIVTVAVLLFNMGKKRETVDLYKICNLSEQEIADIFHVPMSDDSKEFKCYPSEEDTIFMLTKEGDVMITLNNFSDHAEKFCFCGSQVGDDYNQFLANTEGNFVPLTWYKESNAFKDKKNPRGLLMIKEDNNRIISFTYSISDANLEVTEEDPSTQVENSEFEGKGDLIPDDKQSEVDKGNDVEKKEPENTSNHHTNDEIVEMARVYSGAPLAVLDNIAEDNSLNIHLYEDMGDHTATWDWYNIDPNTLKGTDFNGKPIDLNGVDVTSGGSADDNSDEEFIFVVTAPDGYVNVRTGPGTEYAIIEPVSNGELLYAIDRIEYTDTGKAWLKIKGYDEGWVSDTQVTYITDGYILPGSDSSYYDESQLKRLSKEGLRYARNEIYARHGKEFKDEGLRKYFQSREWYHPTGAEVPDSAFNEYEIYNRDLIQSLEK